MSNKKDKTENKDAVQEKDAIELAEIVEETPQENTSSDGLNPKAKTAEELKPTSVEEEVPVDPKAPNDAPQEVEHEEEEETEETTSSISSRILKGLALIVVGMVIALWGAPKLAPMLPQGLAPVAEFLTPGQSKSDADIAALKTELEKRISALESKPETQVSEETVELAIRKYAEDLQTEIGLIKDKLGATDGEAIEARLSSLETKLTGISAELETMSKRLHMQITENGAALSEEAASKLAGYQAVIDGLKAQVEDLAAKNGALSQKVEGVATASARRIKEAEEDAAVKVTTTATKQLLTDISAALDSGAPFRPALDGLAEISGAQIPPALANIAASGTPSWSALRAQFPDVAHAALRADTSANADTGVFGKLGAFLQNQVGTRSIERKEGDDTDAVLSRIEDDLVRGNLQSAVTEAQNLSDSPKQAMADWLSDLTLLAGAQAAFTELSTALGAAN